MLRLQRKRTMDRPDFKPWISCSFILVWIRERGVSFIEWTVQNDLSTSLWHFDVIGLAREGFLFGFSQVHSGYYILLYLASTIESITTYIWQYRFLISYVLFLCGSPIQKGFDYDNHFFLLFFIFFLASNPFRMNCPCAFFPPSSMYSILILILQGYQWCSENRFQEHGYQQKHLGQEAIKSHGNDLSRYRIPMTRYLQESCHDIVPCLFGNVGCAIGQMIDDNDGQKEGKIFQTVAMGTTDAAQKGRFIGKPSLDNILTWIDGTRQDSNDTWGSDNANMKEGDKHKRQDGGQWRRWIQHGWKITKRIGDLLVCVLFVKFVFVEFVSVKLLLVWWNSIVKKNQIHQNRAMMVGGTHYR